MIIESNLFTSTPELVALVLAILLTAVEIALGLFTFYHYEEFSRFVYYSIILLLCSLSSVLIGNILFHELMCEYLLQKYADDAVRQVHQIPAHRVAEVFYLIGLLGIIINAASWFYHRIRTKQMNVMREMRS